MILQTPSVNGASSSVIEVTLSFYHTVSVVIKKVTIGLSLNWNLFKLSVW